VSGKLSLQKTASDVALLLDGNEELNEPFSSTATVVSVKVMMLTGGGQSARDMKLDFIRVTVP
jgi:hypothetical protein